MKKQTFQARFEAQVSTNADARSIDVIASTPSVDSEGRLLIQDWDLSRYNANPVVLWNHGHGGGMFGGGSDELTLPIGYATNVRVEEGKLLATLNLVDEKANPIAEKVFQGFKQGSLRAVSVGWSTSKIESVDLGDGLQALRLSGNELLEISAVAIPANADAVKQGAALYASIHAAANLTRENEVKTMEETTKLFAALGVSNADEAIGLFAGYKAQKDQLTQLLAERDAERAEKKATQRAALITEARTAGKFTPANEESYLAIVGDSVDALAKLVETLPSVVSLQAAKTPAEKKSVLSDRERARLKTLGLSEEKYLANKNAKTTKEEE